LRAWVDLSMPTTDLSAHHVELSDPTADLSDLTADLSDPTADLSLLKDFLETAEDISLLTAGSSLASIPDASDENMILKFIS